MEKQLTSPVVPSRHKTAPLFIILTKPVPPWHQWHTPPTPHWPVTTPMLLRLRCLGSSCPLFVIYSPISDGNIQPLTPPCIDRAQMFTWFPSSYLHETAFNKVGQVHLVCNFVIMVLHNLFAEFEWDCSAATCAEDNLAYFVIIAPRDIFLSPGQGSRCHDDGQPEHVGSGGGGQTMTATSQRRERRDWRGAGIIMYQ